MAMSELAGDLAPSVADHELAGADLRLHPQPDERDRHRVAVSSNHESEDE